MRSYCGIIQKTLKSWHFLLFLFASEEGDFFHHPNLTPIHISWTPFPLISFRIWTHKLSLTAFTFNFSFYPSSCLSAYTHAQKLIPTFKKKIFSSVQNLNILMSSYFLPTWVVKKKKKKKVVCSHGTPSQFYIHSLLQSDFCPNHLS